MCDPITVCGFDYRMRVPCFPIARLLILVETREGLTPPPNVVAPKPLLHFTRHPAHGVLNSTPVHPTPLHPTPLHSTPLMFARVAPLQSAFAHLQPVRRTSAIFWVHTRECKLAGARLGRGGALHLRNVLSHN